MTQGNFNSSNQTVRTNSQSWSNGNTNYRRRSTNYRPNRYSKSQYYQRRFNKIMNYLNSHQRFAKRIYGALRKTFNDPQSQREAANPQAHTATTTRQPRATRSTAPRHAAQTQGPFGNDSNDRTNNPLTPKQGGKRQDRRSAYNFYIRKASKNDYLSNKFHRPFVDIVAVKSRMANPKSQKFNGAYVTSYTNPNTGNHQWHNQTISGRAWDRICKAAGTNSPNIGSASYNAYRGKDGRIHQQPIALAKNNLSFSAKINRFTHKRTNAVDHSIDVRSIQQSSEPFDYKKEFAMDRAARRSKEQSKQNQNQTQNQAQGPSQSQPNGGQPSNDPFGGSNSSNNAPQNGNGGVSQDPFATKGDDGPDL